MAPYWLSEHVYWCARDAQVVLLDLKSDRYLTLDSRASSVFPQLVHGGAYRGSSLMCEPAAPEDLNEVARALLSRNLLTVEPACGKDGAPLELTVPSREVTADSFEGRPRVRARDVSSFWLAIARTGMHLRLLSLFQVVSAARSRREQRESGVRRGGRPCDVVARVAVFDRLRPLAYGSRDACLYESLAMIEFLAAFGVLGSWVFGVQTRPFAAHCWVQLDDAVINDTVEHVRGYTPIMLI